MPYLKRLIYLLIRAFQRKDAYTITYFTSYIMIYGKQAMHTLRTVWRYQKGNQIHLFCKSRANLEVSGSLDGRE